MAEQFLAYWYQIVGLLRWTVPVALLVLVLVQSSYLLLLNARIRQGEQQQRPRRQPDSPIMPTNPADSVPARAYGSEGNLTTETARAPELAVTPASGRFQGKMTILSGLPNVSEIELPGRNVIIGRFYNPEAGVLVSLDERSVSRRHARFRMDADTGEIFLTDLNSSYGTTLRKGDQFEPLTPERDERIYNGDVVQFGSAVTVRFALPGDTRAYATHL